MGVNQHIGITLLATNKMYEASLSFSPNLERGGHGGDVAGPTREERLIDVGAGTLP